MLHHLVIFGWIEMLRCYSEEIDTQLPFFFQRQRESAK